MGSLRMRNYGPSSRIRSCVSIGLSSCRILCYGPVRCAQHRLRPARRGSSLVTSYREEHTQPALSIRSSHRTNGQIVSTNCHGELSSFLQALGHSGGSSAAQLPSFGSTIGHDGGECSC